MSTGVQTAIGRFVWHDHISPDAETARRFYADLVGWQTEVWKPGEFDYPIITTEGQGHGGFGPAQGGAPPHWLGHVLVADVDETALKAEAAGGRVIAPAMDIPDIGRMVVLADPQGAVFSAFSPQPTADPVQSEGVFVWDELATTDVEAAKRFYGEVIGWTSREMDGLMGPYTMFQSGGSDRAGAMPKPAEAPTPYWLTYIATDDVDATLAKADDLGAQTLFPATDIPTVGRIAVIQDPTGAAVGLFKPSS
jgi:predicted enzyme related to lactoylglutathione lyase